MVLACLIASCLSEQGVPVQGWWLQRGSVMPHDSFPADCTLCHIGKDWHTIRDEIDFDHSTETGYALEGAHAAALCLRCHNDRGPVEAYEARGCAGCHADVHRGLLGEGCTQCHDESSWQATGAVADHQRTRFPLTGTHAATECWLCHPGAGVGEFSGADPECLSCHGEDLQRVTDPDHVAQGWTNRCDRCHLATSWGGAGFNHANLRGQCVGCHELEYFAVANPNHLGQGFPSNCELCHTNDAWSPDVFDHAWPRVGVHLFMACVDCHLSAPNIAGPGGCVHCHAHAEKRSAGDHLKVEDYSWSNPQCVDCHPDGT